MASEEKIEIIIKENDKNMAEEQKIALINAFNGNPKGNEKNALKGGYFVFVWRVGT